jgi:hypothetical protein
MGSTIKSWAGSIFVGIVGKRVLMATGWLQGQVAKTAAAMVVVVADPVRMDEFH